MDYNNLRTIFVLKVENFKGNNNLEEYLVAQHYGKVLSTFTKKYSILYYTPISSIPCECEILNLKTTSTNHSIMYINILLIQIHLNV
jgi:hypothetical protein